MYTTCQHQWAVLVESAYRYSVVCTRCCERRIVPKAELDGDDRALEIFENEVSPDDGDED